MLFGNITGNATEASPSQFLTTRFCLVVVRCTPETVKFCKKRVNARNLNGLTTGIWLFGGMGLLASDCQKQLRTV